MNRRQPSTLLNPHLAALQPYVPIQPLEVLSARLGRPVEQLVKLDANENPYGPVPAVREALAAYDGYHIYPDPQMGALREALAERLGVDAATVLCGHGADELLDLLCRLFLTPGDAVINLPPTFGMYGFDARLAGAEVIDVPRGSDHALDVAAIECAVDARVKLVFATSPNNPSGHWLADAELERLLALPAMVVLDEAYVEFAAHESRAPLVARHDNLVVLRTFSKAAGIAGLRLGYGVLPAWLMPTAWKFKQPYNVNVAAGVAGLAAMANFGEVERVVALLRAERERLYEVLHAAPGLEPVVGSQANFILCRVHGRGARELKAALEADGILVRHYASAGLDNYIRVSVGKPEHTDRLAEALARPAG